MISDVDNSLVSDDDETDEFSVLYDENIFKDTSSSSELLHISKKITQSNATLCALIQQGNMQAKQDICIKNQTHMQLTCHHLYYRFCDFGITSIL